MVRSLVVFLVLSLLNPVCMASSFLFCMATGIYRETSTNVVRFDARFFPVYLTVGILVLLLQLRLVYGVTRKVYRGRQVAVAKVTTAFLSSQKPFCILVLMLPVMMYEIEGNVFAFCAILMSPFVLAAGFMAAYFLGRKIKAAVEDPSDPGTGLMTGIARTTAIAVCVSLAVIWIFGPCTAFGALLAWRGNTPQYAVRKINKAIAEGDMASLDSYVDFDSILPQLADVGGPSQADIAEALTRSRRKGEAKGNIQCKNWTVNPNNAVDLNISGNAFVAAFFVQSEVTGEEVTVFLAMQSAHGKYRITGNSNVLEYPGMVCYSQWGNTYGNTVQNLVQYSKKQEQIASLAEDAYTKSQSLVEVTEPGVRQHYGSNCFTFQVTNKGDAPLVKLECAVVLRRKDNGALAQAETVSADMDAGGLSPGRTQSVEETSRTPWNIVAKVQAGRLVLAGIFPVKITYADGRVVELVELPG